jgi:hypothetical protein
LVVDYLLQNFILGCCHSPDRFTLSSAHLFCLSSISPRNFIHTSHFHFEGEESLLSYTWSADCLATSCCCYLASEALFPNRRQRTINFRLTTPSSHVWRCATVSKLSAATACHHIFSHRSPLHTSTLECLVYALTRLLLLLVGSTSFNIRSTRPA